MLRKPEVEDDPSGVRVCLKREDSKFAMNIMYMLNHQNVLSMKALGPKIDDDVFAVFIEECTGSLNDMIWGEYYNNDGHIPSIRFQDILRGIIDGVEYLIRNDLYHGNLCWKGILYNDGFVPKLCNFVSKDMLLKDAQWEDWVSIGTMLKSISDDAAVLNQDPARGKTLFCGEIDALIELIKNSDRRMLQEMKDAVLSEVFFWTTKERTNFITTTISELIHKEDFQEKINKSSVCELKWDAADKNRKLHAREQQIFVKILAHCNKYRRVAFDNDKKSDCVELACAAYTHEDEIKDVPSVVDHIFQKKYPKLFVELKHIVKVYMDKSGTSSQPSQHI